MIRPFELPDAGARIAAIGAGRDRPERVVRLHDVRARFARRRSTRARPLPRSRARRQPARRTLPNMCSHDTHERTFGVRDKSPSAGRIAVASTISKHEHRPHRRAAALGRRAGVQDPHAFVACRLRHVRVAVDDRSQSGNMARSRAARPAARPGMCTIRFARPRLRRRARAAASLQRRLVLVPVHRFHRPPESAGLQRNAADEITGVQDQIRVAAELDAAGRQSARASRQVGVGDDGDGRRAPRSRCRAS